MILRGLVLSAFLVAPAAGADLTVRVHGAHAARGQVLVTLFAGEAAWLKQPMADAAAAVNGRGEGRVTFPGLEPGSYGVSVIYDEDMDGTLDLNLLGIPSEAYGFSNGARGRFGPPDWGKVRFDVSGDGTAIDIDLGRAE